MRFAAFLVAFVVCASAYAAAPVEVPFRELLKHPKKYNGKRVSVRAYVVTSCTHCGEFWENVKAARDSRTHDTEPLQCIAIGSYRRDYVLPKWFAHKLESQDYDGYVHVVGRFETHRVLLRRKSMAPAAVGFGWMGLFDKQITDITELTPLGAPIPAHIN